MFRPKSLRVLIAPALLIAVVAMVACGGSGEEKTTLTKYFNASKMRDNMTLANIATVGFDPEKDGQVQSFSIVSEAPEQVTPLLLKKNAEALKQGTIETAQEAERGIIDIQTLVETNKSLIDTMNEVVRIQTEGRQKRAEAEKVLARMEDELKQRLING